MEQARFTSGDDLTEQGPYGDPATDEQVANPVVNANAGNVDNQPQHDEYQSPVGDIPVVDLGQATRGTNYGGPDSSSGRSFY